MAIKKYWNFANEASIPSEFGILESGNGTVMIANNHLRLDTVGAADADNAGVYLTTPLNTASVTVIYGEVKMSGVAGAWVPVITGVMDSAAAPTGTSVAARNLNLRIWQEYQMSSGADDQDRILLKVKNPSDTQYIWDAYNHLWTSVFTHTRKYFDEDSYYRFVIVVDGKASPKRARSLVYGYTEDGLTPAIRGWNVNYDSTWREFGVGATDIDDIDNSLWVLFGDPITSQAKTQVTFDFRRIMVGEINVDNDEEFGFVNAADVVEFPANYELYQYLNPMPDDQTLWVSRETQDDYYFPGNAMIERTGSTWIKDPYVYNDAGTYWMICQMRSASDNESRIYAFQQTDILATYDGWDNGTLLIEPQGSDTKVEFPWITKYDGTWYMFYDVEDSTPNWRIEYRVSTYTDPTDGWTDATIALQKGDTGSFDEDGVANSFPVWQSGDFLTGTWFMPYGGINGTKWEGGMAISTDGLLSTYARVRETPTFPLETFNTQIDGNQNNAAVVIVDDTTGLNAGDMIYINEPWEIYEVLSVDNGTQFTPTIEVDASDNEPVRSYSWWSIVPRTVQYIGTTWVVYITAFKFNEDNAGQESVSVYVDTSNSIEIGDGTFRQLRVGDDAIDFVIPPIPLLGDTNENLGMVWGELSAIGAKPAGGIKELAGGITGVAVLEGNLKRIRSFSGSIAGAGKLSADLTKSSAKELAGGIAGKAVLEGTLNRIRSFVSEISAMATFVSDLKRTRSIAGAIAGVAKFAGDITTSAVTELAGAITGVGKLSGSLKRLRGITGGIVGAATLEASMQRITALNGAFSGVATLEGALETGAFEELSGGIAGQSAFSGTMKRTRAISGGIAGVSAFGNTLTLIRNLSGDIVGVAVFGGNLEKGAFEEFSGGITGVASFGGSLSLIRKISGLIAGAGIFEGNLTIGAFEELSGKIAAEGFLVGNLLVSGQIGVAPEIWTFPSPIIITLEKQSLITTEFGRSSLIQEEIEGYKTRIYQEIIEDSYDAYMEEANGTFKQRNFGNVLPFSYKYVSGTFDVGLIFKNVKLFSSDIIDKVILGLCVDANYLAGVTDSGVKISPYSGIHQEPFVSDTVYEEPTGSTAIRRATLTDTSFIAATYIANIWNYFDVKESVGSVIAQDGWQYNGDVGFLLQGEGTQTLVELKSTEISSGNFTPYLNIYLKNR